MIFNLKKAGLVKRASAWLLDAILLAVLATGFMWILSLICNFSAVEKAALDYSAEYNAYEETYKTKLIESYGYDYDKETGRITDTSGKAVSFDDVLRKLMQAQENGEELSEVQREAYEAYELLTPREKVDAQCELLFTLLFMMISIGIFLSYLVLEFIIPLFLQNGQTVGKIVFGIGLVRPDCVRIAPTALFARTLLGKYAIETMFPVLLIFLFFFGGLGWISIALFAALMLLNAILLFATSNKTPIHDILAGTVAVDIQTQVIFQSEEEMQEKQKNGWL